MVFNVDREYQLNKVRHQNRLDEAQRERDYREALGDQTPRGRAMLANLGQVVSALSEGWVEGRRVMRENLANRTPTPTSK